MSGEGKAAGTRRFDPELWSSSPFFVVVCGLGRGARLAGLSGCFMNGSFHCPRVVAEPSPLCGEQDYSSFGNSPQ